MIFTLTAKEIQRMVAIIKKPIIKEPKPNSQSSEAQSKIAKIIDSPSKIAEKNQEPTHSPLPISFAWSRAKVASMHRAEFEGATVLPVVQSSMR